MWISKRSYEDLLASHKREVDILRDWVQSLLMDRGSPAAAAGPALPGFDLPVQMTSVSDEEQDLRDALEMGLIDEDALQEGLRQLALANS